MEYQVVFDNAMRNVSMLPLARSESDKTSLFGMLSGLILAAKHADTKSMSTLRDLLGSIMSMRAAYNTDRYMGIKTADLQAVIKTLLCNENNAILAGFEQYSYDDLIQYIEICKRAWQSKFMRPVALIASPASTTATSANKTKHMPCESGELTTLLLQKDTTVAKYIMDNRKDFTTMQVKLAEGIMKSAR